MNWELPSEYRQYAEMIAVVPLAWRNAVDDARRDGPCKTAGGRDFQRRALRMSVEAYDDWAGLQPPRPVGGNIHWTLEPAGRWQAKGELLPTSVPDPRSESLAKALRFT